jgi:hypothetical protein
MWRIGRSNEPLKPSVSDGVGKMTSTTGNRFDSATGRFGVVYFGSDLQTCFAETIARFRPSEVAAQVVREEWLADPAKYMAIGAVPADWRMTRMAIRIRTEKSFLFLDLEDLATRNFLEVELGAQLMILNEPRLDVATIRGHNRDVTRVISEWAFGLDEIDGQPVAGIRYISRMGNEWECWAVFDKAISDIELVESHPILSNDKALLEVAHAYDMTVF